MKKPTRTPLSDEQLADAKRLAAIYKSRARESKARGDSPALTQTEVGEQCGWNSPQSTVSQYINGKVALNLDALIKLARVLKFDPAEVSPTLAGGVKVLTAPPILHERTVIHKADTARSSSNPLPENGDIGDDRYAHIPEYTAMAAAGLGHDNGHVEIRSTIAFKKKWLRYKRAKPENLLVIYAHGASMWPTIDDQDLLLVDRSRIDPADNGVFVVESAADGTLVKRLIKDAAGKWILRSDNVGFQDRSYSPDQSNEHRIVGRVIWRGGDL